MRLSPDGHFYLAMARRELVPMPYARRWLTPMICGSDPRRWRTLTRMSLLGTPWIAWHYFSAMGIEGHERIFAAALLSVLPGVWRCSWRFPVLLDAWSFFLALAVATMAARGDVLGAVVLALLGGATRETIPIFAAVWSWSPWPLVGLLGVGWWRKAAPLGPDAPDWLTHPARAAVKLRLAIGLDASLYLRPWGAALAGLVAPSWQTAAALLLAHAQLVVAQDTIRLTAWAAPVLVLGAAKVIPPAFWPLALLVTLVQRDDRV